MAETNGQDTAATEPAVVALPPNIGKYVLEPFSHSLAAYERQVLKQGVPVSDLIGLLLNHMASVCAQVEPAQARENLVKGLVQSFAPMVQQHVTVRHTTPGGLIVPKPGMARRAEENDGA